MKQKYAKPGLYTMFYEHLKDIAREYGYNLLVNGSMNRDLDLVAVPWTNTPKSEQEMIKEFQEYLTGHILVGPDEKVPFGILPGGRHSYTISLNRGNKHGEWVRYEDMEYYLDISVYPLFMDEKNLIDIPEMDAKTEKIFDDMRKIDPKKLQEPYDI